MLQPSRLAEVTTQRSLQKLDRTNLRDRSRRHIWGYRDLCRPCSEWDTRRTKHDPQSKSTVWGLTALIVFLVPLSGGYENIYIIFKAKGYNQCTICSSRLMIAHGFLAWLAPPAAALPSGRGPLKRGGGSRILRAAAERTRTTRE